MSDEIQHARLRSAAAEMLYEAHGSAVYYGVSEIAIIKTAHELICHDDVPPLLEDVEWNFANWENE